MLRGRITRVGDKAARDVKHDSSAAWALEGDRGITFSERPPVGSRIIAGQWWTPDYAGPPLVSLESEIAQGLGLKIGDQLAVNVAGRTIVARIANLRQVDWRSFGINFVLVFSPSAFAGAPHGRLVTLSSQAGAKRDGALVRKMAQTFPNVTAISVRDALDAVMGIVDKIAFAVRIASLVTLATAALVLGGAIAAGQRARHYDTAILRALGARRAFLLQTYLTEFAMLGAATSLFAILAGALVGKAIVEGIMRLTFAFDLRLAVVTALAGCAVAVTLGVGAGLSALGRKPARVLREL